MGVWEKYVVPRLVSIALNNQIVAEERKKVLAPVRGKVLELGFGSGLNLPHYPTSGIEKVVGIDPSMESAKMASKRIAAAPFPVEHVGLAGEKLDAPPASFDVAVSTFTLCTIPDAVAALRLTFDALRPGGRLYFLEHGRSPDPSIVKWQDRWNPCQKFLCGGCNVNRQIDQIVRDAGFQIESLENYYAPLGPKLAAYMYRGVAIRA